VSDVVETPKSAVDATSAAPPDVASTPPVVSGRAHAAFWLAIGLAVVGVLQVPLVYFATRSKAALAVASAAPAPSPLASASAPPPAASIEPAVDAAPFRIAQLESDTIEVLHAKVGKRTCAQTFEALGVVAVDLARASTAVAPIRKLDVCNPNDRVFVALGKVDHKLHALELEIAPGQIVRAVEKGDTFVGESVNLPVTHKRYTGAFVVVTDLAAAISGAGFDASLIEPLDEALGTRHDVPAPTRGSTFRVIADATMVAGHFDRWDDLVAVEYQPRKDLAPIRLYHLREQKHHGFFDAKGHQPVNAKFRMPLAFPRVTSRFNPRRRHPILKVIMPHNGCDFAAPPGTPVYSIGAGVVLFRGDAGPSGNLISIAHDGGIESGYAHLSRFAPGIVAGTHVEARTLIGYVGTTGRSTGPHLHLSVRRHGVFVDPLSLKMDGFRVVPPSERDSFATRKSEADAALDAIVIPKVDLPVIPAPPAASVDEAGDDEAPSHP
jgi:murein DD-endopeptidase MepM/ murein hydrolase activator NlpD